MSKIPSENILEKKHSWLSLRKWRDKNGNFYPHGGAPRLKQTVTSPVSWAEPVNTSRSIGKPRNLRRMTQRCGHPTMTRC